MKVYILHLIITAENAVYYISVILNVKNTQ